MGFYPFSGGLTSALRGAGSSALVGVGTTGDTANRAELDADGGLRFGSGAAPVDAFIVRQAAGAIQILNSLNTQGAISLFNGPLDVGSAGQGLRVAEGANAKQGTGVLAAGSAVVANTSVTANSRILVTSNVDGGVPGFLRVSARVAGTSFTVTSSSGTDTSTFAYQIFEPG